MTTTATAATTTTTTTIQWLPQLPFQLFKLRNIQITTKKTRSTNSLSASILDLQEVCQTLSGLDAGSVSSVLQSELDEAGIDPGQVSVVGFLDPILGLSYGGYVSP